MIHCSVVACPLQELTADHDTAKDSHSYSLNIFLSFHFFPPFFLLFFLYSKTYVVWLMAPRLIICDTDVQIDGFLTPDITSHAVTLPAQWRPQTLHSHVVLGDVRVRGAISWTNCLWNYFKFPVSVFNMTDSFSPFQNDDLFFYCHCRIHYHKLQFSNLLLWTLESLFIRIIRLSTCFIFSIKHDWGLEWAIFHSYLIL